MFLLTSFLLKISPYSLLCDAQECLNCTPPQVDHCLKQKKTQKKNMGLEVNSLFN